MSGVDLDLAEIHKKTHSANTQTLAEIHWYLLKADTLIHGLTHRRIPTQGTFTRPERTEFGKEVGFDEIAWWVTKKETDLTGLRERTERAFQAAQALKMASEELRRELPQSFDELTGTLRGFVDSHAAEIGTLLEYVGWLHQRDVLGPIVLFTYRVWGSTRLSDRYLEVECDSFAEESPDIVFRIAETVLGLWGPHWVSTIQKTAWDIGGEIYDSTPDSDREIDIPLDELVKRSAWRAYGECATYFAFIRDSLRNILLDVDTHIDERNLISNDSFWRTFIAKAVSSKNTETSLWDFKETLTMWRAKGDAKLRGKIDFVESLAAFANANGGVLVIGVADDRRIVGIVGDAESMIKAASDAAALHLDYPRPIVSFHQVLLSSQGSEKLCLTVVVAQACEPAGVNDGNGRYSYPVRRGTGLARVSREESVRGKVGLKSESREFLKDLEQFIRDN